MTDREKRIMSCIKNEYGFTSLEAEMYVMLLSKYKDVIRKHIQELIDEKIKQLSETIE